MLHEPGHDRVTCQSVRTRHGIRMTSPEPFRIEVSDETLERIRAKVAGYVWHEMPDDGRLGLGANLDYMKELCGYWLDEFDWRAQEEMLNRFAHFTAPVDGIDIHFIHERGSGPAPLPLLISHGWPGSVSEFARSSSRSPIPNATAAARAMPST